MNYTHWLEIFGDENDGDTISSKTKYDPTDTSPYWKYPETLSYLRPVNLNEIIDALSMTLSLTKDHNWSRLEYDNFDWAYNTLQKFVSILYRIDIDSDEFCENFDEDELFKFLYEELNTILPCNGIGVHTIEKIVMYPMQEELVLYQNKMQIHNDTTLIVSFGDSIVYEYNTSVLPYRVLYGAQWAETNYYSEDEFKNECNKGIIIWRK